MKTVIYNSILNKTIRKNLFLFLKKQKDTFPKLYNHIGFLENTYSITSTPLEYIHGKHIASPVIEKEK